MTTYYKATRPDGRDFYSGTIDYSAACGTGEVIRHPSARKTRDDAATYLSVSIAEADCTGFRWPARLFRVEPVGRVMTVSASENKRAVSALRVVEELPSWRVFGPNGEAVVALIERASSITSDEKARLGAAFHAAGVAAWNAARVAAWNAAWNAARVAAGALVVRDLISPEHFETLYAPWRSVMEDGR